jgi:hypothetical protein
MAKVAPFGFRYVTIMGPAAIPPRAASATSTAVAIKIFHITLLHQRQCPLLGTLSRFRLRPSGDFVRIGHRFDRCAVEAVAQGIKLVKRR